MYRCNLLVISKWIKLQRLQSLLLVNRATLDRQTDGQDHFINPLGRIHQGNLHEISHGD